jgi:membrane-associated phospholipid phosphatase
MRKVIIYTAISIFLVLCFIFNKYDLDISIALTKHYNGFYEFFDDFGELPIYMGPILFGSTFFFFSKNKWQKIMFPSIVFISYSIALIKVIHNMEYSWNIANIGISLLVSVILTIVTIFFFSKAKRNTLDNIKDLALLGMIVSVASLGVTEVLKYTWGRVRFRDLGSDYSEFTKLFHINGLTGHKSFPSGHTNAGTSILLIALLIPRFTDKKWMKNLVTILCFTYISILAISRIVVSAHYASDVLCGFVVGFTTVCVTYKVLKRKGVINAAGNKC